MVNYIETKEDKISYLKGLIRLIKCDGKVADEEVLYFKTVSESLGLDEISIDEINGCWEKDINICISFSSTLVALFFIQEAVQLCLIDDKYEESEKKEIRLIADEIKIDEKAVEAIEKWVLEGLEWKARGEALINELAEKEEKNAIG